ncbi:MAG: hypothetical protein A2X86_11515 [Bdellovibrionales bacterium GWA2_49_15]|nr:MAG: hypothetical protein A2X86_11515 [Bdellovibrionales bacterium GWA2_49_15]HAZ12621.1 hypothetical protein [Bdellovibrionales bacterium]
MALNNVKNIFQNKRFLKIFSFFVAVALWLFVTSSRPVMREEHVGVKLILPEDQSILDISSPLEVQLQLQGARIYLQGIQMEYLRPVINLSRPEYLGKTDIEMTLRDSDFFLPFGVTLVEFKPKTFKLRLDKKGSKTVMIRPVYQNKIDDGYKLVEQKLVPSEAVIEGPKELLKNIDVLLTRPIDLHGPKGQGEFTVPLELLGDKIMIKSPTQPEVNFQYDIRPISSNVEFKNVPIRFVFSSTKFHADHSFVNVKAFASNRGEVLSASKIQIVADIPEGQKGDIWVELKSILPPGMQLLELQPSKIFVRVK